MRMQQQQGSKMPRWVQVKTPEGSKLVPAEEFYQPKKQVHHIMPDIEPYHGIAGDCEYITSRSKEREYLKRNNCTQVGNEWNYFSKFNGKSHDNPTREW